VFSGTIPRFPEIPEFKSGTHLHFRNFGISEIPTLKPLFSQETALRSPRDFNSEISGISGDLGDTFTQLTKFPENFGKTGNSGI
jgi:hypothetical protein